MMMRFRSTLVILCGLIWLIALALQSLVSQRQKELELWSQQTQLELNHSRLILAHLAHELAHDEVLRRSISQQHRNTYSSLVKSRLRTREVSYIGIYNKNCALLYSAHLNVPDGDYCRLGAMPQLLWLPSASSSTRHSLPASSEPSLMVVTRSLGAQHRISVGIHITPQRLMSLLPPRSHKYLRASLLSDNNSSPTRGASLLAYSHAYEPQIYDHHPITRHFPRLTAPYTTEKLPTSSAGLLFFIALGLWLHSLRRHHAQTDSTLQKLQQKIADQARFLKLEPPNAMLQNIFESYHSKINNLEEQRDRWRQSLLSLHQSLEEARDKLKFSGYFLAREREVERNAQLLLERQRQVTARLDDLDDLSSLLAETSHREIHKVLSRWHKELSEKGARKFLRSYLERCTDHQPLQSILEQDIAAMLAGCDQLSTLRVSLHQRIVVIHQKNRYLTSLLEAWSQRHTLNSPSLAQLLAHTLWQVQLCLGHQLILHRPSWNEPASLPAALARVLRATLYEVLSAFPDQSVLTLHYLALPSPRLLLSASPTSVAGEPVTQYEQLKQVPQKVHDIGLAFKMCFAPQRTRAGQSHICYCLSWQPHQKAAQLSSQTSRSGSELPSTEPPLALKKLAPKNLDPARRGSHIPL